MEHIKRRRKKERKKEIQTNKNPTDKPGRIRNKVRPRSYLLLCVKKLFYFKNTSKPCNSSDLSYVDKIILID